MPGHAESVPSSARGIYGACRDRYGDALHGREVARPLSPTSDDAEADRVAGGHRGRHLADSTACHGAPWWMRCYPLCRPLSSHVPSGRHAPVIINITAQTE